MAERNRGFTLIEILVVITIIAGLMGLGFVLLKTANESRDVLATSQRIQALNGGLVTLSNPQGYAMVPHTDLAQLRGPNRAKVGAEVGVPNDTNLGIEAVFVALYLKGVNLKEALDEISDDAFGNTDEDEMAKNPTRTPNNGLMEFVDAWGNPIAYFRGSDMKNWKKYSKYVMADKKVVEVKPWMRETTGDFINANSFQIFSAGPDGEFNTDDDIKSWQ